MNVAVQTCIELSSVLLDARNLNLLIMTFENGKTYLIQFSKFHIMAQCSIQFEMKDYLPLH